MRRKKTWICCMLAMLLLITGICPVPLRGEEHYAVTLLKKLDLYSAADDKAPISGFDCALWVLLTHNLQTEVFRDTEDPFFTSVSQLSGAQANLVKQYFFTHPEYGMQSFFGGSVAAVPSSGAAAGTIHTTVPSYRVYATALVGLGYQPGTDFTDDKEAVLACAVRAGFRQVEFLDTDAATYENMAEIFYEMLFLPTKTGEILLRKMSGDYAALAKAVEESGVFNDVSTILPDFTGGVLINGSATVGGTSYTECQVQYAKVTEQALQAYADTVKAAGWSEQAVLKEEVESTKVTTLYYTFQRRIQNTAYYAVLALDTGTGVLTVWYAY